ncbi:hypothetical protein SKAU_G00206120 [Synaphobranchus kaupii]|uniref:DNA-directed RNA polymerase subunit n=1 Tax=Synaphobranchus kaupii TaxID=118154 RepID=A0A9Q1IYP2_SYNKA|nr:hypothetical protein SKAU_G00206120 [Synaphobranchus kaupii]
MAKLELVAAEPQSGEMSIEFSTSTLNVMQSCAAGPAAAAGEKSAIPCLIPAFADACKLVDAPYSCLVVESHRRHVALSPLYLRKKKSGIEQQLDAELLKYSESLKGVPLAYDTIKVVGQHGDIYDDNGFIHMNIEALFVIFQPKRGQKLSGVINKVGVGHRRGWGRGLSVGDMLEFQVSQLDADTAGVLLIRGRLDKHRARDLAAVGGVDGTEGGADGTEGGADGTEEPIEGTATKKKKKDKNLANDWPEVSTAMDESAADEFVALETAVVNGHSDGKKKKKKKEAEQRQQDSPIERHISDSSGYHSDKSSRKRKKGEEEGAELSSSPEEPEPKKKKKKNKRSSQ